MPAHLQEALQQLEQDRRVAAEAEGVPLPPPPQAMPSAPLKPKRWKYRGPWLAGMTNLEFDQYLKHTASVDEKKFRKHLMDKIREKKEAENVENAELASQIITDGTEDAGISSQSSENQSTAASDGQVGSVTSDNVIPVTEEEINNALRTLRSDPEAFGAEIAQYLDLPEGPPSPPTMLSPSQQRAAEWTYSRDTVASEQYKSTGPPRIHPSAGFSYVRTTQFAHNDPKHGPQIPWKALPARLLRDQAPNDEFKSYGADIKQAVGVGGIVARFETMGMTRYLTSRAWNPTPGGPRLAVKVVDNHATVMPSGAIDLAVQRTTEWALDGSNQPYNKQEKEAKRRQKQSEELPSGPQQMEYMDERPKSVRKGPVQYRRQEPLLKDDNEVDSLLAKMTNGALNRYR